MDTLTKKQCFKAIYNNDYILARWSDNSVFGVNCKIMRRLTKIRNEPCDNTPTNIIGYHPINFQEYISTKVHYGV